MAAAAPVVQKTVAFGPGTDGEPEERKSWAAVVRRMIAASQSGKMQLRVEDLIGANLDKIVKSEVLATVELRAAAAQLRQRAALKSQQISAVAGDTVEELGRRVVEAKDQVVEATGEQASALRQRVASTQEKAAVQAREIKEQVVAGKQKVYTAAEAFQANAASLRNLTPAEVKQYAAEAAARAAQATQQTAGNLVEVARDSGEKATIAAKQARKGVESAVLEAGRQSEAFAVSAYHTGRMPHMAGSITRWSGDRLHFVQVFLDSEKGGTWRLDGHIENIAVDFQGKSLTVQTHDGDHTLRCEGEMGWFGARGQVWLDGHESGGRFMLQYARNLTGLVAHVLYLDAVAVAWVMAPVARIAKPLIATGDEKLAMALASLNKLADASKDDAAFYLHQARWYCRDLAMMFDAPRRAVSAKAARTSDASFALVERVTARPRAAVVAVRAWVELEAARASAAGQQAAERPLAVVRYTRDRAAEEYSRVLSVRAAAVDGVRGRAGAVVDRAAREYTRVLAVPKAVVDQAREAVPEQYLRVLTTSAEAAVARVEGARAQAAQARETLREAKETAITATCERAAAVQDRVVALAPVQGLLAGVGAVKRVVGQGVDTIAVGVSSAARVNGE
eukprot:CAMPEP_0204350672 /NCGR_PEP_ID=MMETSP0469-20131031/30527_1 /ASSEMBLY_ACC=CAM_ASM_000384 /TAXON_ID=2969 /ORGANISM="Oxyrrhis marina" /LENGTH=621 /DNA_ID=CAMNT_0051337073 /DNA_START=40 /DNA_END=1905 /DNA_ORIENTATION=-